MTRRRARSAERGKLVPSNPSVAMLLLRGVGLFVLSSSLGFFFAFVAAGALGLMYMMPMPGVVGLGLGAIQTPCLWVALRGRGAPLFLFLIVLGTTLATVVGAVVTDNPLGAMGLSMAAYIGLSGACVVLRRTFDPEPTRDGCRRCGYPRMGLPSRAPCPECGHAAGAKP
jgi:hypothetical protein